MYYLSRRVLIMLTCSVLITTIVFFTAYGVYGAPSSAEDLSHEAGDAELLDHLGRRPGLELKQVHVVSVSTACF